MADNIALILEEASAALEEAYEDWSDKCRLLQRAPDREDRLKDADEAHQRYIIAKSRMDLLIRQIMDYIREIREAARNAS